MTRKNTSLLILCILSIIAVAVAGVMDAAFLVVAQMPVEDIKNILDAQNQAFSSEQLEMCINVYQSAGYHLIFNALELVGLILLLTERFIGFHFYAASQVGLCYVAYSAFGLDSASTMIFFNLMWIVIYFWASRGLRTKQAEQ